MGEETTRNWVIHINQSLTNLPDPESESHLWKKRSIYKVPPCMVDLNKKAYHPHVVSFGPYHHGDDHLRPMEYHKSRALLRFLKRSGKELDPYLDSLRKVVETLRECYDPLESPWRDDTERFLKLMILDGCFMLEILRMEDEAPDDYAENDPIFSSHRELYVMPFLRRDMLMIENQLPLLVLEQLVAVEKDGEKGKDYVKDYVIGLVLKFWEAVMVAIDKVEVEGDDADKAAGKVASDDAVDATGKVAGDDAVDATGDDVGIGRGQPLNPPHICPCGLIPRRGRVRHRLSLPRIRLRRQLSPPLKPPHSPPRPCPLPPNNALTAVDDIETSSRTSSLIRSSSRKTGDISDKRDYVHVLDVFRKTLLSKKAGHTRQRLEREEKKGKERKILNYVREKFFGICVFFSFSPLSSLPNTAGFLTNYNFDKLNMPSATKLREAGIHFKKVENGDLRDINFKDGVLEVPAIVVDDSTESIFLNLMAFESLHVEAGDEVTSYVNLMDDLIDSDKDVALLRSEGIIWHFLGSDKEAANLINSVTKEQTIDFNRNLSDIRERVNKYRKKRWNKWRANLIQTYFRNPWSALALIGALSLFALTTVQTTYTVLQYYQPGK